ncbi:MAG: hypothetical protein NDF55_10935 [archaeon GB-1867-005]|nr:hypothetical protein [Candidatus Culexmicrobium cathedralense]
MVVGEVVITIKAFCNAKKCAGLYSPAVCSQCIAKYGLNVLAGWKVVSAVSAKEKVKIRNIKEAVEAVIALMQKYGFRMLMKSKILGGRRIEVEGILKPFDHPSGWDRIKIYVTLFREPFWSFPKWLRDNKPDAPETDYAPAVTINYSLLSHAYYDNVDYLVYVTKDGKILAVSPKLWWRLYVNKKGYVRKKPLKTDKTKTELVAHIPITELKPFELILESIKKEIRYRIESPEN